MADALWKAAEGLASVLTTELNALADAGFSAASSEIDNTTGTYGLYTHLVLELALASFTPGSGFPYVAVYIIYEFDGSNYEKTPDGSSGDKPPAAIFPLEASVAQASRVNVGPIPILPFPFKLVLQNEAGAALAASGNTLKASRVTMQSS